MSKLLIISSNIHKDLSALQLEYCTNLIDKSSSSYEYQVEVMNAGSYEIPFVIKSYHEAYPFDGYITLGLILNNNTEHYQTLLSHLRYSFTQFSLNNIAIGNGIITGESKNELLSKLNSEDPCQNGYYSAFKAVDYLIQLKLSLGKMKNIESRKAIVE